MHTNCLNVRGSRATSYDKQGAWKNDDKTDSGCATEATSLQIGDRIKYRLDVCLDGRRQEAIYAGHVIKAGSGGWFTVRFDDKDILCVQCLTSEEGRAWQRVPQRGVPQSIAEKPMRKSTQQFTQQQRVVQQGGRARSDSSKAKKASRFKGVCWNRNR